MGAPRIRAEYDNLTQIAKLFSKNSAATQSALKRLSSKMETLQNGHWIGQGAKAFYAEMESSILPSVKGLADALAMADRVTRGIVQIMHETDEEAASLIQVFDAGALLSAIGAAVTGVAAGAAAAAGSAPWKKINNLLARDPGGIFSADHLRGLINLQIKGAGPELGAAMEAFLSNPSRGNTDNLIIIIIKLRGRPEAEIRVEFEQFQEAMQQRNTAKPEEAAALGGGGSTSFMGSMTQMRYGSIVGEAFGIDPTFGAMLNPGGGLIGPGNWSFAGPDTAVGYHKIAHDAAGYLHNFHNVGPGYDYMGGGAGASSSPNAGHTAGLRFWRKALGSSTGSNALGNPSTRSQVGGINRLSQSINRSGEIY